jgi:N-acetylglucosaminyldiphosphoundecaprenol N-acetyl-beta-D-mannosaminyltransferase
MTTVPVVKNTFERVEILGLPIDCVTMTQAIDAIDRMVASGGSHLVVTADASGMAQAQEDRELFDIYHEASLVTPDSIGVIWAARRKRAGCLTERVSGVELVDRICALSANKGYRIFFLGAAPGVAELAAEKLRVRHPGCNIVGTRNGYFPADSDAVVAEEIAALKPDFLFVAMGIPRQEKFILATRSIIQAKVAMGVGGSFDVFSGTVKRAPVICQKLKIEWLWRLILNPAKISKVKMLPKFVGYVLREKR